MAKSVPNERTFRGAAPLLARASLALVLLAQGCALDEGDLSAFRSTATGPEKLRAVLKDAARPSRLRAAAALNLLDLERSDVDGRAALFGDLKKLDHRGRNEIVPSFKTGLSARMRTVRGEAPSASALRAKDAGVELLPMLGQHERALLGTELLSWILEDMGERADQGSYSLEVVAERVGPGSTGVLIDAISADLVPKDLERLVRIVHAQADASGRAAAANRLVQVEKRYRQPDHRRVLLAQLEHEKAFAQGTEQSLVNAHIEARRRDTLRERLLPALGQFSEQTAARARLLEIAAESRYDAAERDLAFGLLRGRVGDSDIDTLLRLALDEKEALSLRELALNRAGETGSRELLPSLLVLVSDRNNASLRRRAGELYLEIGGPSALQSFFRALPHPWDMTYPKAEIDAYASRVSGFPLENHLVLLLGQKLHSVWWWNRVIALRYFAERGIFEDAWRIRQHLRDAQPITGEGWPADYTVGHEAVGALAIALERFRKGPKEPTKAPASVQ